MKKVLAMLAFIILVVGVFYLISSVIKIQNITCKSQYGECDMALKSELLKAKNEPVFKSHNDIDKILKNNKTIDSYVINFQLPLIFNVNIIQKKAIVAFVTKENNLALVDDSGNIVSTVSETKLPKVISYTNLDQSQLAYVAKLMNELYTFYGSTSGKVTENGLEIEGIRGKRVIFPLTGDMEVILGSLALILSRLPSVKEASTISVIDLRYKNPVLR